MGKSFFFGGGGGGVLTRVLVGATGYLEHTNNLGNLQGQIFSFSYFISLYYYHV